jgi:hypothetical protein
LLTIAGSGAAAGPTGSYTVMCDMKLVCTVRAARDRDNPGGDTHTETHRDVCVCVRVCACVCVIYIYRMYTYARIYVPGWRMRHTSLSHIHTPHSLTYSHTSLSHIHTHLTLSHTHTGACIVEVGNLAPAQDLCFPGMRQSESVNLRESESVNLRESKSVDLNLNLCLRPTRG